MNAVEYLVGYQHTTHIIKYQVVFSMKQMKFLKPIVTLRGVASHLKYRLLPGHYYKFSFYAWRNEVEIKVYEVTIENQDNITEDEILKYEFDWEYLEKIKDDPNAPQPLKDFLSMMPGYHGAPFIKDIKYDYKSPMQIIRELRDYLDKVTVSE